MFIFYDKKTQEVKMVSENKIKVDETIFDVVEDKKENWEDYKNGNGYKMWYRNEKIEKEKIENAKDIAKEKLKTATSVDDLKDIINNLI